MPSSQVPQESNPPTRLVLVTLGCGVGPASQPVRDIRNVTSCCAGRLAEVSGQRDQATVVASRRAVRVLIVVQVLHEAVAVARALHTVLHHVGDRLVGVVRVERGAVVGLHEAGVDDASVRLGLVHFRAAVGLRED